MSSSKFEYTGTYTKIEVYEDKVNLTVLKTTPKWQKGAIITLEYELITEIRFIEPTWLSPEGSMFFMHPNVFQGSRPFGAMTLTGNEVHFKKDALSFMKEIKEYIEKRIITIKSQSKVVTVGSSAADEIRKFKQLLDEGIITQSEFDEKKKQLL